MQRLAVLTLLLAACCPTKAGEPGDEGAINWRRTWSRRAPTDHVIDCDGGRIDAFVIRESRTTVQNCIVQGSIRIEGPARNGNAAALHEPSRRSDYVSWIRSQAPHDIEIVNVAIEADGGIPLYIAPGVTYVDVRRVAIYGQSNGPMVYLDAETSSVTIEGSRIDASEADREAIAVDASDHNTLYGNVVVTSETGGVFLYRNCGEAGNVRHTTPSFNLIERNHFIGDGVAVLENARNGNRCYCDEDAGYPFGSSQSDLDHARGNVVRDNTYAP